MKLPSSDRIEPAEVVRSLLSRTISSPPVVPSSARSLPLSLSRSIALAPIAGSCSKVNWKSVVITLRELSIVSISDIPVARSSEL